MEYHFMITVPYLPPAPAIKMTMGLDCRPVGANQFVLLCLPATPEMKVTATAGLLLLLPVLRPAPQFQTRPAAGFLTDSASATTGAGSQSPATRTAASSSSSSSSNEFVFSPQPGVSICLCFGLGTTSGRIHLTRVVAGI